MTSTGRVVPSRRPPRTDGGYWVAVVVTFVLVLGVLTIALVAADDAASAVLSEGGGPAPARLIG
jgi:hypothetical protein